MAGGARARPSLPDAGPSHGKFCSGSPHWLGWHFSEMFFSLEHTLPILLTSCSPFTGVKTALRPKGSPHLFFSLSPFKYLSQIFPPIFVVGQAHLDALFSCNWEVFKHLQVLILLPETLWAKGFSEFRIWCIYLILYTDPIWSIMQ